MRISDWSSDVCSSDLDCGGGGHANASSLFARCFRGASGAPAADAPRFLGLDRCAVHAGPHDQPEPVACLCGCGRSEEHTSELQSLMRISYAVFCLIKKIK